MHSSPYAVSIGEGHRAERNASDFSTTNEACLTKMSICCCIMSRNGAWREIISYLAPDGKGWVLNEGLGRPLRAHCSLVDCQSRQIARATPEAKVASCKSLVGGGGGAESGMLTLVYLLAGDDDWVVGVDRQRDGVPLKQRGSTSAPPAHCPAVPRKQTNWVEYRAHISGGYVHAVAEGCCIVDSTSDGGPARSEKHGRVSGARRTL